VLRGKAAGSWFVQVAIELKVVSTGNSENGVDFAGPNEPHDFVAGIATVLCH